MDTPNSIKILQEKSYHMVLRDVIDLVSVFGKEYLHYYESKPAKLSRIIEDDHDNDDVNRDVPYNSVEMSMKFKEDNMRLNSWVNSSTNNVYFKDIPLSLIPMNRVALTLYDELTQQNSQFCGITNREITTFDGVQFNYNLTECWHVITKDASGKSRIIILARTSKNSINLDLEINLDNYKVIRVSEDGIFVNKKQVTVSPSATVLVNDKAETPLVRIDKTVDSALNFNIPSHGFKLIYTNTSAVIYAYSGMQNRLVGLCGDYNFETFREFTDPKGGITNIPIEFGSSYRLDDKSCAKYI